MVSQDKKVEFIKILRSIEDLEDLYQSQYRKMNKLHIRPANIPSEKQYYELSINYNLLDRESQQLINPYIETYKIKTMAANRSPLQGSRQYVIPRDKVHKVEELLKLPSMNYDELGNIYEEFIEVYDKLLVKLSNIFEQGTVVDQYFGTKYYAKKIDALVAFSIDEEDQELFMMDYSIDDDVPRIFLVDWDKTLVRAIKSCCFSESNIEFYSVY